MKVRSYRRWLTVAALAIAPVLAPRIASAQYQSQGGGNAGHALDANSQVGSGGINGSVGNSPQVTGNNIIYGNVTGGRQFRGNVDTFGSGAFQGGPLAGSQTDSFVRDSSGAPSGYSPTFSSYTPRQFYGQSRGVNPPPGTILLGPSGAAIGTSLTPANPYASVASPDQLAGIRVGSTNVIGYSGQNTGFLAVPGASPNSSFTDVQQTLSGSMLYGSSTSGGGVQFNAQSLDNALNNPMPGAPAPGSVDPNTLYQARQELSASSPTATGSSQPGLNGQSTPNSQNTNGTGNSSPVNPYNTGGPNPLLPQPGPGSDRINPSVNNSPLEMPVGSPLGGGSFDDRVQATPLGTYSESPNGVQLVSPKAYSATYGEMTKELQRYTLTTPNKPSTRIKPSTPAPTTQPGGLQSPGRTPGTTPGITPGTTPGLTPALPGPVPSVTPSSEKSAGVKISSIAGTVTSARAKGLHDLLAKADDSLKNDHFKDAIGVYEGAARVAPNNQMITLGLANADLAGGYYAAAETNIGKAFAADANVLMARQDLTSMISASRLDFVKGDLKDLADKNPKLSRPWFLLAYIAYNTGHEQVAADDLKEAQKRAGLADTAITLMQKFWQLPSASDEKTNLNK
jgi:hypothetical protein